MKSLKVKLVQKKFYEIWSLNTSTSTYPILNISNPKAKLSVSAPSIALVNKTYIDKIGKDFGEFLENFKDTDETVKYEKLARELV